MGGLLLTLPGNTSPPQVPLGPVLVTTVLGWGQTGQQPTFLQEVQKWYHQLLQDDSHMLLLALKSSHFLPSITSSIGYICLQPIFDTGEENKQRGSQTCARQLFRDRCRFQELLIFSSILPVLRILSWVSSLLSVLILPGQSHSSA